MDFQRAAALEFAIKFKAVEHQGPGREHEDVLKIAKDFLDFLSPPPPAQPASASIVFDAPTPIPQEEETAMTAVKDSGQRIVARISEADSLGNPTTEPGTWTVDRTDLVNMTVADDGMSATFTPTGVLGTAIVSLTVGNLPTATGTLDVVPGDAATVNMTFDAPTDVTSTGTATPSSPPAGQ
jgi:hypothetical protein